MIAGLVLMLAGLSTPVEESTVPNAVIERFVNTAAHRVHVTLFDNRVVVVSAREGEDQVVYRRTTLPPTEYKAYLEVIRQNAAQLSLDDNRASIRSVASRARLYVAIDSGEVVELRFSPFQVLDKALAQLNTIVDDLQARAIQSHPAEEELRTWEPRVGDRVQLMTGALAIVTRIFDGGVIELRQEDASVTQFVAPDGRLEVISGLVEARR
ncbi:MAG: hypothetical protein GY906_19000 [bacterium]|nr:hypothetical protein [bacterium]